jgi:uncharacterized glyoxalase superfamily protein PhnB
MCRVSTYLNFFGNTSEAFEFYREPFGTEFIEPIVQIGDMPGVRIGKASWTASGSGGCPTATSTPPDRSRSG